MLESIILVALKLILASCYWSVSTNNSKKYQILSRFACHGQTTHFPLFNHRNNHFYTHAYIRIYSSNIFTYHNIIYVSFLHIFLQHQARAMPKNTHVFPFAWAGRSIKASVLQRYLSAHLRASALLGVPFHLRVIYVVCLA